jgi:hypothetical protein
LPEYTLGQERAKGAETAAAALSSGAHDQCVLVGTDDLAKPGRATKALRVAQNRSKKLAKESGRLLIFSSWLPPLFLTFGP